MLACYLSAQVIAPTADYALYSLWGSLEQVRDGSASFRCDSP